ncbi:MAG: flagellar hook-length control protein FliK [Candidatus Accumulibacter sp.]|jgi:flagellar hook-length control protein FliK|nr:flagellar hook-length control protein FliK [Accumulibacter sp.]
MTIAIVSALPGSAQPPATNAAAGSDGAAPEQDFISLLLGQLGTVRLGAGAIPGAASESAAGDSGSLDDEDAEDAEAGDPSDLLAALTQAPFEQRGTALNLGEETGRDPSASAHGRTLAGSLTQDTAEAKLAAASEPAAKFAALVDAATGKTASTPQESAGFSAVATLATGVQARRDDAAPASANPIPIPTPLHDRGWNNDFAQKVTWVVSQQNQSANLTLNPPAMGSIEIAIKLDNDRSTATATFVSSNAEVRETIETALPKLREMLAGIGIELGEAQVSAESFRQAAGNGRQAGEGASPSGNDMAILAPDSRAEPGAAPVVGAGRGLVDMFV